LFVPARCTPNKEVEVLDYLHSRNSTRIDKWA
jgi:hypothetical protein